MPTAYIGFKAPVVVAHLIHADPPAVRKIFQIAQLSAFSPDLGHVDFPHHLSGTGQNESPVQKVHALA